jgi:uncharacterized protein (DUF2236 family)
MIVSAQAHQARLNAVVDDVVNPSAGLFGPGSITWHVSRESIAFLGGGRAALLQAAHPFVAQAIVDHSKSQEDLAGRFQGTFINVFAMVFGELEEALTSARRVHRIHRMIRGTLPEALGPYPLGHAYEANDEDALFWVFATLIHTSIQVYEMILGPVPLVVKNAFLSEGDRFAALFGVPSSKMPPNWAAFEAYMAEMVGGDRLAVGKAGEEICHFLMEKPPRRLASPAWAWYRLMTVGLLPEQVRDKFGLSFGRRDRVAFRMSLTSIRTVYGRLPGRLRYLPAYTDAMRRLDGHLGEDLFGRVVKRMVMTGLGPAT